MNLYSWNVNGIRAMARKGLLEWIEREQPDVLCVQETKAHRDHCEPEIREPKGYGSVWHSAQKRGYSGVATFFKPGYEPLDVRDMGVEHFDDEGRVQILEYAGFYLINGYFPNSQPDRRRLAYKLAFMEAMTETCNAIRRKCEDVVVCGDFNIAHKEIDLARPNANRDNPGFYPEECESLDRFHAAGYADAFRHFHPGEPGHYTWWSYRAGSRDRNVGWRLDYHWVNAGFMQQVEEARILCEVPGSDHCPVVLRVRDGRCG